MPPPRAARVASGAPSSRSVPRGHRVGAVPPLFEIVRAWLARHASCLTTIGDVPPHLVLPVLAELNAIELAQVEKASNMKRHPATDALWKAHVQRDFPLWFERDGARTAEGEAGRPVWKAQYKRLFAEQEQRRQEARQRARKLKADEDRQRRQTRTKLIDDVVDIRSGRAKVSSATQSKPRPRPADLFKAAKRRRL